MVIQKKLKDNPKASGPDVRVHGAFVASRFRRVQRIDGYLWALALVAVIAVGAVAAALGSDQKDFFSAHVGKLATTILVLSVYMGLSLLYMLTSVHRDVTWCLSQRRPFMGSSSAISASKAEVRASRVFVLVLISGAIYSLYGLVTGVWDEQALVKILVFTAVPLSLCYQANRVSLEQQPTLLDGLAVASIWLPFNFGLLESIWTWPQGKAAYIVNTPLAMAVALVGFVSIRRFSLTGIRFQLSWSQLKTVLVCLVLLMLIAIPVGLSSGFLEFNPRFALSKLFMTPLGIFFFIALPEELLFRGIIYGMFVREFARRGFGPRKSLIVALVVSSLLFGISHWHDFGPPPVIYISLATVAGLFYGWTYTKTGSLTAAVLLHTLVDTLWEWFFHAGS